MNDARCRLEVRCCCQPQKLMGTLPAETSRVGAHITFSLAEPHDYGLTVADHRQCGAPRKFKPIDAITLEIAKFMLVRPDGTAESYPAIKAEGVPIETLRLIPGFVEADAS